MIIATVIKNSATVINWLSSYTDPWQRLWPLSVLPCPYLGLASKRWIHQCGLFNGPGLINPSARVWWTPSFSDDRTSTIQIEPSFFFCFFHVPWKKNPAAYILQIENAFSVPGNSNQPTAIYIWVQKLKQALLSLSLPNVTVSLFVSKQKKKKDGDTVFLSWVSLAVIGLSSPAGSRLILSSDDVLGKDQKVKWARWWNENGFCKTYLFSIYLNILRLQNCKNMLIWQIY